MLPGNQFASPVRTYRRIRTMKKDVKCEDSSSTSSSSSDEKNEQSVLLKTHDRQVDCLQISPDHDDSEANVYSRNYDSHRARRRTICRQPDSRARADDAKLKHPHEKKFAMKKLPRYITMYIVDLKRKFTKNTPQKIRTLFKRTKLSHFSTT